LFEHAGLSVKGVAAVLSGSEPEPGLAANRSGGVIFRRFGFRRGALQFLGLFGYFGFRSHQLNSKKVYALWVLAIFRFSIILLSNRL